MKLADKVTVIKYKPVHTETEMTFKEFCDKYRDNLNNAFENWIIHNEEKLPMSVIKDTEEATRKAMIKIFDKDFCKNFNENAYIGIYLQDNKNYSELGAKGLCVVKTYDNNRYVDKTLEFVHVITR